MICQVIVFRNAKTPTFMFLGHQELKLTAKFNQRTCKLCCQLFYGLSTKISLGLIFLHVYMIKKKLTTILELSKVKFSHFNHKTSGNQSKVLNRRVLDCVLRQSRIYLNFPTFFEFVIEAGQKLQWL